MKLQGNLTQPGATLFFAPALNVILLLLVYTLLNPNLTPQAGLEARLPASTTTLRPFLAGLTVSIRGAETVHYEIDGKPIPLEALRSTLAQAREDTGTLLIRADADTPLQWVMRAQDIALNLGYEVAVAARPVLPSP